MPRPREFVLTDDMRLENAMAMHARGEFEPLPGTTKRVLTLVADELAALRRRVAEIASKDMLLDALDGVGVPERLAGNFQDAGLATDDGSQFLWNRDELSKLPAEKLLRFYLDLKADK